MHKICFKLKWILIKMGQRESGHTIICFKVMDKKQLGSQAMNHDQLCG